jgi:hypothetical protein
MAPEQPRLDETKGVEQIRDLIDEVVVLLELSRDFDVAWNIANEVCDRYGLGRAAA